MRVPTIRLIGMVLLALAAAAGGPASVGAAEPVRIGELNSYTRIPAFTLPYRNGWTLAVEQINAAGGVLGGRPLAVVSRDDGGDPGGAVRVATELLARERVVLLAGTFFSHVGLAVSNFAAHSGVVFLAAEPLSDALTWDKGNRFTFRLRPSTYMQAAMLAEEAAKLDATRWVTVAPNYEYGQSAVHWFRTLLQEARPDVTFVGAQWPALGRIRAGATVQALAGERPDAIFNVTFGADLAKFVREGALRGLFEGRAVVSLLTGEPEYLLPLQGAIPEGWIVTGYPWRQLDTPAHTAFRAAYEARFGESPRMGSIVGYATFQAIAAALERAGGSETEALIAAFEGLTLDTPFGAVRFRTIDHQATLGTFVGRLTADADGHGRMAEWRYADGAAYLPDDGFVREQQAAR